MIRSPFLQRITTTQALHSKCVEILVYLVGCMAVVGVLIVGIVVLP